MGNGRRIRPTNKGPAVHADLGTFLRSKQKAGSFILIDSVRDLVGAALKYKGYSLNSTDPKQLKEARDLVIEAKKRSLGLKAASARKTKCWPKLRAGHRLQR